MIRICFKIVDFPDSPAPKSKILTCLACVFLSFRIIFSISRFLFLSSLVERLRPLPPDFGKHMLKTMEPKLVSVGASTFCGNSKKLKLRKRVSASARSRRYTRLVTLQLRSWLAVAVNSVGRSFDDYTGCTFCANERVLYSRSTPTPTRRAMSGQDALWL